MASWQPSHAHEGYGGPLINADTHRGKTAMTEADTELKRCDGDDARNPHAKATSERDRATCPVHAWVVICDAKLPQRR